MKKCTLCRFSKTCNDLPYVCILLQYLVLAAVVGFVGYLFFAAP